MRTVSRLVPLKLTLGLVFICAAGGIPGASAGTVRIEQSTDRSVVVVADGATLSEVVGKLGETYGFRLDHKGGAKSAAAGTDEFGVNGRYEGTLRGVLDRLLAKESYFIEHANGSKSGIARVVLYNVPSASLASAGLSPVSIPAGAVRPALVERTPPAAAGPTLVPPVRRVQPVQPQPVQPAAAPVRPGLPLPPAARVIPGQTAAAGGPPPNPQALRKRGFVLE